MITEERKLITEAIDRLAKSVNQLINIQKSVYEKDRWQLANKACHTLGISYRKCIEWSKDGTLICKVQNPKAKHPRILIDVIASSEILASIDEKQFKTKK